MKSSSGKNPDKGSLRDIQVKKREIVPKTDFDTCYIMAKNTYSGKPQDKGLAYVLPKKLKKFQAMYPNCTISRNPIK